MIKDTTPLLSIITPCLNRVEFVAEAIESVVGQSYPQIEHIIVDGGSTDGTLQVLARYPHLLVISEPDHGIYDAINKGIRFSHGEIIGLLNTDDVYEPGVFTQVVTELNTHLQADAITGAADIFEQGATGSRHALKLFPPIVSGDLMRRITLTAPIINAWFFRRRVFDQVGLFDIRYRIASDSDWLLRFYRANVSYETWPGMVYHYRQHPGSLTIHVNGSGSVKTAEEVIQVAENYLRSDLSLDDSRYLRIWHMTAATVVVKEHLRRGQWLRALHVFSHVIRHDPMWLVIYLSTKLQQLP